MNTYCVAELFKCPFVGRIEKRGELENFKECNFQVFPLLLRSSSSPKPLPAARLSLILSF